MTIYPFLNDIYNEKYEIQVNQHGQVFQKNEKIPRVSNLVSGNFGSAGETQAITRGKNIHDQINSSYSSILREIHKTRAMNISNLEEFEIELDGGENNRFVHLPNLYPNIIYTGLCDVVLNSKYRLKTVLITDFKTGRVYKHHKKQIWLYAQPYLEQGYTVYGLLRYIDNPYYDEFFEVKPTDFNLKSIWDHLMSKTENPPMKKSITGTDILSKSIYGFEKVILGGGVK